MKTFVEYWEEVVSEKAARLGMDKGFVNATMAVQREMALTAWDAAVAAVKSLQTVP